VRRRPVGRLALGGDALDGVRPGNRAHAHISLGWSTAAISCVVLLAWWPLRERPGIGTIANLIIIAYVLDITSATVPIRTTIG